MFYTIIVFADEGYGDRGEVVNTSDCGSDMRGGDRGEVVNTSDCGSDMRGFDSHRSPHLNIFISFYFV